MRALTLAATFLLTACASTEFGMNQMVQTKNISIAAVPGQSNTYQIEVLNTVDAGWDGGNPQDRQKVVNFFLGSQCAFTNTLSDTPVPSGTYTFTTKARVKHTMMVQCIPK